ncbi:hypothetical protein KIN20_006797 [Parelaphostrongylus tenuis]|uniref:Uncharacterized protein n=1 Tax=Parelaphostrongylus tenuis TaxID=148309 RepID=A0AAD5MKM1_PARTN|nr:hypothetical protein KIN20_006797 [Parelaphostrongylus tenuis]
MNCSIFRCAGKYFAQTRELATEQQLSPNLTIAFMFNVEAPVIDLRPSLYYSLIFDLGSNNVSESTRRIIKRIAAENTLHSNCIAVKQQNVLARLVRSRRKSDNQ